MPVHAVAGGWQWGNSGKVYRSKAAAQRQAAAIYASGWREDQTRRAAHRVLSASGRAEARYVLDLVQIMGAVHRGAMKVVEREHLAGRDDPSGLKQDDEQPMGLGDKFLKRVMVYVKPRVEGAFDRMAKETDKNAAEGLSLVGINPHHVAGVDSVIAHARRENVNLISSATQIFVDHIKGLLEEHEGEHPDTLKKLLEERVKVSSSRASLIARDQTLKLHAAITQHRQRAAGVTQYRWSTSHDERVRPAHRELDGQTFSWDAPPETNDDGDTNNPGEDYQCRCVALPLIPELEEPDEPEAEETPEPEAEPEPAPEPPRTTPSEDDFKSVSVSPNAVLGFDDVVAGATHEGLRAWLKEPNNQPILSLEGKRVPGERSNVRGLYMPRDNSIAVTTDLDPPLERNTNAMWGDVWGVSDRGVSVKNERGFTTGIRPKTSEEQAQGIFLHELGHHVHLGRHAGPDIDAIVEAAYRRTGLHNGAYRSAVMSGRKSNPAISKYATTNRYEYFAESFNAYMSDPHGLKEHDPGGFAMVAEVLRRLRIEE